MNSAVTAWVDSQNFKYLVKREYTLCNEYLLVAFPGGSPQKIG